MHISQFLLGTAALLPLASASPMALSPEKEKRDQWPKVARKFTANQGRSKKSRAGPVSRAKVYRKYGKDMPSNVAGAAATYLDGTAVAVPELYDIEYLVNVTIGGQVVALDFDTGSSDLWVYSSQQPQTELAGHSFYTPSASSTELQNSTWNITYADGSGASGNVYLDWVSVGATNVSNQAIELAKDVSDDFLSDVDNDGLLGLAFGALNTVQPQQQSTFIENAINQNILSNALFTADLKASAPGSYDFGFIDSSKFTGRITYTSVSSSPGYWTIQSTGYGVGNTFVRASYEAIADTGTTLIYLDNTIVTTYWSAVQSAQESTFYGGIVFNCSETLPDLIIGIENYRSTVPGRYLSYAPVESGSATCYGGLQSNEGLGLSILGDVWLKSQFVIFDVANLQLGVAPKTLTT